MTKLWCYVEGERNFFSVSISPDQTIYGLKKQIKEERSNLFLGVDAAIIALSKVCYFYSD